MKISMIKTADLGWLLQPAAKMAMMIMMVALMGGNVAWAQAAGGLDPTFGTGGTVSTSVANPEVMPLGALEQSNGDIVVIFHLRRWHHAGHQHRPGAIHSGR